MTSTRALNPIASSTDEPSTVPSGRIAASARSPGDSARATATGFHQSMLIPWPTARSCVFCSFCLERNKHSRHSEPLKHTKPGFCQKASIFCSRSSAVRRGARWSRPSFSQISPRHPRTGDETERVMSFRESTRTCVAQESTGAGRAPAAPAVVRRAPRGITSKAGMSFRFSVMGVAGTRSIKDSDCGPQATRRSGWSSPATGRRSVVGPILGSASGVVHRV